MGRPPYYKKGKTNQSEWANLNGDLLQRIFKILSFVDVYRTKPVCSWWNKNAEEIFRRYSSSSSEEVPWLFFPPQEGDYYLGKGDKTVQWLNLEERRFYNSFNNAATEKIMGCNCSCVGSSHGWLVCLDEFAVPFLLNPFTCKQIQLPHMGRIFSSFGKYKKVTSVLRTDFVEKGILSSSHPSNHGDNCVALIYGIGSRLAFCRVDGDGSWTELDGKHAPYEDIIMRNRTQLCALAHDGSLEVWDIVLQGGCISPTKKTDIDSVEFRWREDNQWHFVKDLHTLKYYLVESDGDLLLVIRCIGEIVNAEGEAVSESYLLREDSSHPLELPYRTLNFQVFRLENDHKHRVWMQVDSLGNRVLFLGGNESISIRVGDCKKLKRDSIYFTDDYWERMDGDYLFGGHDMGVFSLQDASLDRFDGCHETEKIKTPPMWVVPHPW